MMNNLVRIERYLYAKIVGNAKLPIHSLADCFAALAVTDEEDLAK